MKRFILSLVILLGFCASVNAEDYLHIPYKNIKEEGKIKYENGIWSDKVAKRETPYFIKLTSEGTGNYSEFYNSDGQFAFSTGTQYEFIHKGNLIGYSNHDLKFYEFGCNDDLKCKRKLTEEEIQELFPDFKIVKISEFSKNTNSLKVKKDKSNYKVLLLNDTDRNFYHYSFTSGNSKFDTYKLKGLLNIKKRGMIQFSHFGDNTKDFPWFILLVR